MSEKKTHFEQHWDKLSDHAKTLVNIIEDLEGEDPKDLRTAVRYLNQKYDIEVIEKFLTEMSKALKPLLEALPKEENNG